MDDAVYITFRRKILHDTVEHLFITVAHFVWFVIIFLSSSIKVKESFSEAQKY